MRQSAPAADQNAGWEHLSVLPFDVKGKDDFRFNSDAGVIGAATLVLYEMGGI